MTQNPWKSVQRALRDLTGRGKAKIENLKRKASGKSIPLPNRMRKGSPVKLSEQFVAATRGTPGRRATRWLDDAAVARARMKAA